MMIFQHTIDKVLSGEKTQTRRLRRLNETLYDGWAHVVDGHKYISVWTEKDRCLYMVGKEYAVQPGRGQKAVGRIRLTGIRAEDVREISEANVRAEGFTDVRNFWQTWCKMNDELLPARRNFMFSDESLIRQWMSERPAERYQAWVLEFELVQDNGA